MERAVIQQPTVCGIMLTLPGREAMARRAAESFAAQTYERKVLSIWQRPGTIGALRNIANEKVDADIIVHIDDDDISHPARIAEQVSLLQATGADVVGYNELLFWREPRHEPIDVTAIEGPRHFIDAVAPGEAWLYTSQVKSYFLGTSMCYWRKTWEQNPFPDKNAGCDDLYWTLRGLKVASVSAMRNYLDTPMKDSAREPRMVASIHGRNTCAEIKPGDAEWRRAPEYDAYCVARMNGVQNPPYDTERIVREVQTRSCPSDCTPERHNAMRRLP